jgi:hypothetical protein
MWSHSYVCSYRIPSKPNWKWSRISLFTERKKRKITSINSQLRSWVYVWKIYVYITQQEAPHKDKIENDQLLLSSFEVAGNYEPFVQTSIGTVSVLKIALSVGVNTSIQRLPLVRHSHRHTDRQICGSCQVLRSTVPAFHMAPVACCSCWWVVWQLSILKTFSCCTRWLCGRHGLPRERMLAPNWHCWWPNKILLLAVAAKHAGLLGNRSAASQKPGPSARKTYMTLSRRIKVPCLNTEALVLLYQTLRRHNAT